MIRAIALLAALLTIAPTARAATMTCKPTYREFFEFECQSREPAIRAASFCGVMDNQGGPLRWSRNDTYETKARADLVNAVGKRLCGWGRK